MFLRLGAGVKVQISLGVKRAAADKDAAQILHRLGAGRHGASIALGQDPRHVVLGRGLQPNRKALPKQQSEGGVL